jgi:sigma-B regulation protein RsbU (phosphoserine phosphatase)
MVLARAGHLPLYLYRRGTNEVERVLPRGLGFGLSSRPAFDLELEECSLAYEPGDVFLFVTDGVTECQDAQGEFYGEDRLRETLRALAPRHPSAAALRDGLEADLRRFVGDSDAFDDQTIVVVRAV